MEEKEKKRDHKKDKEGKRKKKKGLPSPMNIAHVATAPIGKVFGVITTPITRKGGKTNEEEEVVRPPPKGDEEARQWEKILANREEAEAAKKKDVKERRKKDGGGGGASSGGAPQHKTRERDDCWPDGVAEGCAMVNDVSRLNSTAVHRIFQVRTLEDVVGVVQGAKEVGKRVSVRGTKHSMGGHTINEDGVVIDMEYVAHMRYDRERDVVTVGAGAMWAQVIRYLNGYGKAPRTLQSYCSFSVGGTLSVNGHGITTDHGMAESVVAFTLVTAEGDVVECGRDAQDERARELFGLALGGYGLFGVIYEAVLRVNDNVRLFMDAMTMPLKEFPHVYDSVRGAPDVEIKLARIDTTTFATVSLFVFRRESDTPTVSDLGIRPKEMSPVSRLMYKWFAGPMREARFAIERQLDVALDWSDVSDRNEMLYESAHHLARLYSPLLHVDDTFVLQEYFVPHPGFARFVSAIRPIVLDRINKETDITLLNITIRYVNRDTDTAIPYARHEQGVFAFVLYYRLRRTSEADALLQVYHSLLADAALAESGTFYLPYRHHYTDEQLARAYPGFPAFCERKAYHDPSGLFGNLWWDRYGAAVLASTSLLEDHRKTEHHGKEKVGPSTSLSLVVFDREDLAPVAPDAAFVIPEVSNRRTDSFRKLLADPRMRREFMEGFLVDIFSIVPNKKLYRRVAAASWDGRNKDDTDIYSALLASLADVANGPIAQVTRLWRSVKQLADQKKELVRETVSILARLGKIGDVHDYVSIGDNGKLILPLRKALGMTGHAWIVHDQEAGPEDIAAVLERGAAQSSDVGEFVSIDYNSIRPHGREFSRIGDGCCDLVTMNQGLHHLPQDQIMDFLAGVHRILRPGGLLIVREHDLDKEGKLLPMLDCAHMVFNAATGVSIPMERDERRGFRPLLQWREIIQAAGFRDSYLYEMQPHDPTIDIMMCFYKPPLAALRTSPPPTPKTPAAPAPKFSFNWVPGATLEIGMAVLEAILNTLPKVRNLLQETVAAIGSGVPGLKEAARIVVDQYINPMLMMLERFRPLAAVADPQLGMDIIPEELFLIIPALRARAAQGGIMEVVLVSIIDKIAGFIDRLQEPALPPMPRGESATSLESLQTEVSDKEVTEALAQLVEAIPKIQEAPEGLIDQAGLPTKAAGFARSYVASNGVNMESAKKWIIENVDKKGWLALSAALRDICKQRQPPTLDLVLKEGTPWNRAAIAVLGCPKVQLSRTVVFLASTAGLGGVVKLWTAAQKQRRHDDAREPGTLSGEALKLLQRPLDDVCPVIKSTGFADLTDVLAVISASYVGESLLGLPTSTQDVTAEVAALLDPVDGSLPLSKVRLPPSWRMGSHTLVVHYRRLPRNQDSTTLVKRSNTFARALAGLGLIDGTARAQNGPLTWYKLPEWMQVEIVQLFGNSMEHTPWYRFPFMDVLKTYFGILSKEVYIVANRHGWNNALGSSAFFTDLVPGIAMSILFGQMALLAYPLRQIIGEEYDQSLLVEQLVVAAPRGIDWTAVDNRITDIAEITGGVWVLTVPTFKPFTELLIRMAQEFPSATILQISNQSVVQVKLEIPGTTPVEHRDALLDDLRKLLGCEVLFDFRYPHVGGDQPPNTQVSLGVQVPFLLSIIRSCQALGLSVAQIYDFYD